MHAMNGHETIHALSGSKLRGGHSFRVTSAQRLASLGMDVITIMVFARWAGGNVLRYIKDAPLGNLPSEVLTLEDKRELVKLVEKIADGAEAITGKVTELDEQAKRLGMEWD